MRILQRVKSRGISLLEVLLSLSIIAIILIMATRYFFVANENKNINEVRTQIGALVAAAELWKGSRPTYAGMTMQGLIEAGDFPKSMDISNGQLFGPWGNPITLTVHANTYTISTIMPSAADCEKLNSSYPHAQCQGKAFTLSSGTT